MRYLLRYHLRLGDIVRCLPIAEYLDGRGNEVWFECLPEYHGIFELVDYATPIAPGEIPDEEFDRVLDLQVWPERYEHYRSSEQTWGDYVFGLYEEGRAVTDRRPRLSNIPECPIPPDMALVAPAGFSQIENPTLEQMLDVVRNKNLRSFLVMMPPCATDADYFWTAPSLPILAAAIKHAADLVTIDTGTNILAAAVGRKSWYYFANPIAADAYRDERQIVVPWRSKSGRLIV